MLRFLEQDTDSTKTKVWVCVSPTVALGRVSWRGAWRAYVFSPLQHTLFDSSCLEEIKNFLEDQTKEKRAEILGRRKV